tara:strand:- start:5 stop:151 length:147 start_codon:yes stop_codon:yes gene_type:complete
MENYNCTECGVTENARDYIDPDGVARVPSIQGEDACVECYYTYVEERV